MSNGCHVAFSEGALVVHRQWAYIHTATGLKGGICVP